MSIILLLVVFPHLHEFLVFLFLLTCSSPILCIVIPYITMNEKKSMYEITFDKFTAIDTINKIEMLTAINMFCLISFGIITFLKI